MNEIIKKRSDEDRHSIAKYASKYGATAIFRNFKSVCETLNKSTVQSMIKNYEKELKKAVKEKRKI